MDWTTGVQFLGEALKGSLSSLLPCPDQ